ncbi:MAG: biosynthetic peptidoglycan transglycosylase [Oligoflexia bacterium]|nr:biosynthetic peptidoglycan transglycosylase [Oligoflexia bacterium]
MNLTKNAVIRSFAAIGVAAVCIGGLMIITLAAVFLSLPDASGLKKCMTTEMNKVQLCESGPKYVKLSEISPNIIGAIIMSEDAAFYSHEGVDYDEMKESVIKDINEGRFARGASTITQQLAKNVFTNGEKSLLRKAKEIYLAFQIEKIFTKPKILEIYLNVVEFGPEIYGIKEGAQYYFKVPPSQVRPEQAAFLAFLLPNPKKYSQSFRKNELTPFARKTIKTILRKMLHGHKISEEEYNVALARVPYFPWQGGEAPVLADGAASPAGSEVSEEGSQEGDDFKFDFEGEEEL